MKKKIWQNIFLYIRSFLLFFGLVAFVITCSFLLFFHSVELNADEVREFAPLVFFNVFVLATVFVVMDALRRSITVERPVKKIQSALHRLKNGDFSARVSVSGITDRKFKDISNSINLLAEELSGVETLRTDFIANVSHELKTPLAVMQNYGTLLQQKDLSEEKRMEYAGAITDASNSLANLITNILKLNKLENQQIFPSVKEYNLSEQLCESLLQFEDVWEKKNLNIETDIEDDVVIHSDSELLSLVWNNLFSNAMKFTEPGGSVFVSLKTLYDTIIVKVRDNGCGIKPETGAHIFEKFYQGDTSHATKGNGLGLALVKRVVDIMHGEIQVESVYGSGSTFTVKIQRYFNEGLEKDM